MLLELKKEHTIDSIAINGSIQKTNKERSAVKPLRGK